ncbi:hypothetical protein TNCT_155741 [Trichonephila clavata]|uniref:Uncharacterized protein n=1 Tax=Trichonephila clavata TaxID=2740835 RepID=A0A8X6GK73_TRICU|nr:hypothetical protein TNCT_155741 [Trichonephila clavata]
MICKSVFKDEGASLCMAVILRGPEKWMILIIKALSLNVLQRTLRISEATAKGDFAIRVLVDSKRDGERHCHSFLLRNNPSFVTELAIVLEQHSNDVKVDVG